VELVESNLKKYLFNPRFGGKELKKEENCCLKFGGSTISSFVCPVTCAFGGEAWRDFLKECKDITHKGLENNRVKLGETFLKKKYLNKVCIT